MKDVVGGNGRDEKSTGGERDTMDWGERVRMDE
jgi:hypothetical protein